MERCPCGDPHQHSVVAASFVESVIRDQGRQMKVSNTSGRMWLVPRIYIALHGLRVIDLPELAARYKWSEAYRCPTCERVSWNPNDLANRYCGKCGFQDGSLHKDGRK